MSPVKTRAQRKTMRAAQTIALQRFDSAADYADAMTPSPVADPYISEDAFPFTLVVSKKKKGKTAKVSTGYNRPASPSLPVSAPAPHFDTEVDFPELPAGVSTPHAQADNYPTYVPAALAQNTTQVRVEEKIAAPVAVLLQDAITEGASTTSENRPSAFASSSRRLPPAPPAPPAIEGLEKANTHWVSVVQSIKGYTKLPGYSLNDADELCDKWLLSKKAARLHPNLPPIILHPLRPVNINAQPTWSKNAGHKLEHSSSTGSS